VRRWVVRLAVVPVAVAAALTGSSAALAHPLGNFTVNQYAGVVVAADEVRVTRVVDMAEIPTVQQRRTIDTDSDGEIDPTEATGYSSVECQRLATEISLSVDGAAVDLAVTSSAVTFPAGQAGLLTLRLECDLAGPLDGVRAGSELRFRSDAQPGRLGWREVTVAGDGVTVIDSDVPAKSPSAELTAYPEDLLTSPLSVTAASATLRPGGPRLGRAGRIGDSGGLLPRGVDRLSLRLTSLVSERDLTVGFALVAFAIALGLGALHALSPGHGKTVMAAYLVGQRGTVRQAALIGLTVTATHTIGVVLLGIALTVSTVIAPERVIPWLSVASGLLLAAVGLFLLRRAVRAVRAARRRAQPAAHTHSNPHDHDHAHHAEHDHGHDHPHDDHAHDVHAHDDHAHDVHAHDHPHAAAADHRDEVEADAGWHEHGGSRHQHAPLDVDQPLHWRSLVALGFAGGLVPSPSALVVLLGAIALDRAWFGLVLVLGFGLGMAATLMAAGLLLERGRRLVDRRTARLDREGRRMPVALRLLPVLTSAVVIVVGITVATRGATIALG